MNKTADYIIIVIIAVFAALSFLVALSIAVRIIVLAMLGLILFAVVRDIKRPKEKN